MGQAPKYELTIDLNTLKHLGIGLYSNTPAVIAEVVANSWDADATKVEINIDVPGKTVTIADDGWGMTKDEINQKYLRVGYPKRDNEPRITPKKRHVMGRKGIGKLSLFSIASTIEVHSVKADEKGKVQEKNGFIMNAERIEEAIKAGPNKPYCPDVVDEQTILIKKGTSIGLRDFKKGISTAETFLRKRLARRFSILGTENDFSVLVNGKPITVEDRDYFGKIEYLWCIGQESEKYKKLCSKSKRQTTLDGLLDAEKNYSISGWVGTFDEQKSIEEGNNTIVILAWGKLIHEDILKDLKEGGIFTKYLIGEIRADFLDVDEDEDIVTSNRQSLKEDDPRFQKLKTFIQNQILKTIQSKWRDWRNEDAENKALENPKIKEWFDGLGGDNKKYARVLFSKIEGFPIESPDYKKELYKHGILAFETLALKQNLSALEAIDTKQQFETFLSIFSGLDELEAAHYYQIAKNRVAVLKKFQGMVPTAKERVIQEHIFDHLWLLDTSWERASTDQKIEQAVTKEFGKIDAKLKKEEKSGRVDIRYRTAAGKHIIIELKKYDREVTVTELIEQIEKYRSALEKCLQKTYPDDQHIIEIICILGDKPNPKNRDKINRDMLKTIDARYITYDQLIRLTRDSYRDYLDKEKKIGRIQKLIDSI
jgi:hypothetical protein